MKHKNVLIGVTGGIAAYKAAALCSKLVQQGCSVKVIMTRSACEFIAPLTFQTITAQHVVTDMFSPPPEVSAEHISLSKWADAAAIYPATANCMGKLASGIADDMLSTVLLATPPGKVILFPAMNSGMLENPAVKRNFEILKKHYTIMESPAGYLACGDTGRGRLMEPEDALIPVMYHSAKKTLAGKKLLITAGPTLERLDPVRYLSNFSSGKMGYALAEAAQILGADVTLVSGPSVLRTRVSLVKTESAEQMYQAVNERFDSSDAFISAAAVMDYSPEDPHNRKIKKSAENTSIALKLNRDILAEMGERKKNQIVVGFAAETENIAENAVKKMQAKHCDFIAANYVSGPEAGFGQDTNTIELFSAQGGSRVFENMSKIELAFNLLNAVFGLHTHTK